MLLIRQKLILREDLKNNPTILYIFGDNLERKGYGGQAKEMRGELNSFGIATKRKAAHGYADCYFYDSEEDAKEAVKQDFQKLRSEIELFKSWKLLRGIIIPSDGIGTGLAKLKTNAPELLSYINCKLQELGDL